MKNWMKRIWIAVAFVAVFLLTGCGNGSTVNTYLNIDESLSGYRDMELVISESTFNEYFNGSLDDLNNVITNYIPEGMVWSVDTAISAYTYHFAIYFSSVEEYTNTVNNILGWESTINMTFPDSVWASGIYVEEDFTSEDLLYWLSDAIVLEGLVSDSYASQIFSIGDTNVVYTDMVIPTSSSIYVNEIEYVEISEINFYTERNELGAYDRTVEFVVSADSMTSKGDAIREYMDGVKPSNAEYAEETNEAGNTVFTFRGTLADTAEMTSFMASLFGEENYSVAEPELSDASSPFVFSEYFVENMSFANYLVGNMYTDMNYLVKNSENGYQAFACNGTISSKYPGYEDTNFPGYSSLLSGSWTGEGAGPEVGVLFQKYYPVSALEVSTSRSLLGKWSRETKLTIAAVPTDEEKEIILAKISAMADPLAEEAVAEEESEAAESVTEETSAEASEEAPATTMDPNLQEELSIADDTEEEESVIEIEYADVDIDSESTDEAWIVTIGLSGSESAMRASTELLLGAGNEMMYAAGGNPLAVVKNESYLESLDYGDFMGSVSNDYSYIYTLDLGLGAKQEYCDEGNGTATLEGGKLVVEGNSYYIDVEYAGTYIDVFAVIFWVFVGLAALLLLWMILTVVIKKAKEKKANAPVKAVAPSAFCTNCGAPRNTDSAFCTQCGTKF